MSKRGAKEELKKKKNKQYLRIVVTVYLLKTLN